MPPSVKPGHKSSFLYSGDRHRGGDLRPRRAELLHAREFLRNRAAECRARPSRRGAHADSDRRGHRLIGRRRHGACGRVLRRRVARSAPPNSSRGARRPRGGGSRRRAQRCADFAVEAPGADRDARHVLALSRRGRRDYRSGGELQRVPAGISRARAGVYRRGHSGPVADLSPCADRVCRSAASIGHRAGAVCDRLQLQRRAVRRHPRREQSRPGVFAVGHCVQHRGCHLCRPSGAGALGCGKRIRARRHYRGGPRRNVGVRRARDSRRNRAGAHRAFSAEKRIAGCRAADRVDWDSDRRSTRVVYESRGRLAPLSRSRAARAPRRSRR